MFNPRIATHRAPGCTLINLVAKATITNYFSPQIKHFMKIVKPITGLLFVAAISLLISALFSLPFMALFIGISLLSYLVPGDVAFKTVVSNPLIGASRKSMGNATFSNWKGIYVLKTKPISVANPQTDGQQQQRSAFSQLVEGFRNMPAVIQSGFKKLAVRKSEFNAFMAYNLKNAFDLSVLPTATLVPADVLISKGTIASTAITTSVSDRSSNNITVTFPTTTAQPGQSATDVALVAAYNVTKSDFYGEATTDARSTGTSVIDLPAEWETGDTLRVYVGFSNPLTKETSDSTNIADAIVA
jgi:hypothetical protein